jgi:carboxypeptidase Q
MRITAAVFFALAFSLNYAQSQTLPTNSWDEIPHEARSATRAFSPELRAEMARIRDAALTDDYAYKELEHLTDSIGPRPEGSPQANAAVHYVADELRKLGLDVTLEPVPVPRFIRGNDTAELVEYPGQVPGTRQKIVVTALYGNAPTPEGGLTGEIVVAHSFGHLKSLGKENVAGKIVLFDAAYDSRKAASGQSGEAYGEAVQYRAVGALAAAKLGAIATLVRSAGDGAYRLAHTGYSADAHIPAGAVSAEDAMLIARLAARGPVKIHLSLPTHIGPEETSYNVIGDLKGSEHSEQVVIVSGHLDSWDLGTGAIDDGAGVVMAMETAELLHRLNLHPKRTIRVVAWMNEETGATGSFAYARDHALQIEDHIAAMESDSGAEHPLGFQVRISNAAQQELSPVLDALQPVGANLLDMVSTSPETDIEPLSDKGVPAFGIWQNQMKYFLYHHTAADTLDKVAPSELRENAACMAVMAYALADTPEPLPR